jgi:hypothetical protein
MKLRGGVAAPAVLRLRIWLLRSTCSERRPEE